MQEDDLLGVLYLEIPYRYKFSKKFKIDDWFVVKPYDKAALTQEKSIKARVVVRYSANVKLTQDVMKNIEGVEITRPNSPKKEFKTKLRDISRELQDHEKEGFFHLEDVEKKIRARRRKNKNADVSAEQAKRGSTSQTQQGDRSASVLAWTLTRKKQLDLGAYSRLTQPLAVEHKDQAVQRQRGRHPRRPLPGHEQGRRESRQRQRRARQADAAHGQRPHRPPGRNTEPQEQAAGSRRRPDDR